MPSEDHPALPDPPVPADLDLRDFRWMPLDLVALFNSDFNTILDDTAWRAGVTLWGRSWHQVPASSLPDDDGRLCSLCGLGKDIETWRRVRAEALRCFAKCSDGRLYHPFLARLAIEAWERRAKERKRQADFRARRDKTVTSRGHNGDDDYDVTETYMQNRPDQTGKIRLLSKKED